LRSLQQRIALWDGVYEEICQKKAHNWYAL
jgi:hypothetical protein